jgi:hypothetical protein
MLVSKTSESVGININLAVKSLPKKITEHNLFKIDLIHFTLTQKSLISFFNDDQDEMFSYYDTRMKSQLSNLNRKSLRNSEQIESILDYTKLVYDYF